MKRYNFLICYDIANKKRLQKITRVIEKNAIRIQYSIFLLPKANKEELYNILDKVLKIHNKEQDDIRVYNIKNRGINLASGLNLEQPFNFI